MTKQKGQKETARDRGTWQGMNWIRQDKRLAIYLRDGVACMYCGRAIEDGATMSLDHVIPHSHGGSNSEHNLVTCCCQCNKRRGNRTAEDFAVAVAGYVNHGVSAEDILSDIRSHTGMSLKQYRTEARELIARRGSAAKALEDRK